MAALSHHKLRDYAQTPLNVYWEMTQACALACRHCRAEAVATADPRELTFTEGGAFLRQILDFGDPLPQLILTGGDPLARADLYELIDAGTKPRNRRFHHTGGYTSAHPRCPGAPQAARRRRPGAEPGRIHRQAARFDPWRSRHVRPNHAGDALGARTWAAAASEHVGVGRDRTGLSPLFTNCSNRSKWRAGACSS